MQSSEVRRLALRAAQLVTLSSAALSLGCPTTTPTDAGPVDVGPCALARPDTNSPDASSNVVLTTEGCCETIGGYWTGTVCQVEVFGPFVPPSIDG